MEMPWAERKALVSRMHKIDTGILTGFAGMHNFNQLFGLRSSIIAVPILSTSLTSAFVLIITL